MRTTKYGEPLRVRFSDGDRGRRHATGDRSLSAQIRRCVRFGLDLERTRDDREARPEELRWRWRTSWSGAVTARAAGGRSAGIPGRRSRTQHRRVRSGFWGSPMLRPDGRAEVEEIAASVRERVRVWRPEFEIAIEHLACRIWRQRRAYADISENGLVRDGQPAPMLRDLAKLEGQIRRDLDAFGLTPRSAAALGLSVAARDRTLSLIELHAAAAARRGPSVELLARYGSDPVGFSRRRVAPDIEPSRDLDQTSTIKRRMVSLTSGGTSSIP